MSLTVTEANAVFDLGRWLADTGYPLGGKVSDVHAVECMEILAAAAGRRLQVAPDAKLPALIVERLRAADSDGAAQAVCRALDAWRHEFDRVWNVPQPIRDAHETWRRAQDATVEVAR